MQKVQMSTFARGSSQHTELTRVIRKGIRQLGKEAKLVNATAKVKHSQKWKKGRKGEAIPKTWKEAGSVPFTKGEKTLFVQNGADFYYFEDDDKIWYQVDPVRLKKSFDVKDSIKPIKDKKEDIPAKATKDGITATLFLKLSEMVKSIKGLKEMNLDMQTSHTYKKLKEKAKNNSLENNFNKFIKDTPDKELKSEIKSILEKIK